MTATTCPVCDRHTLPPGRTACHACVTHLRHQLHDLPGRMDAVTDAIGRRLRFGDRVGGKSADTPPPVNMTAAEAAYIARTTILTWTDHIAQERCEPTPDTWPTVQTFLDVRAAWLAGQDDGPAGFDELLYALGTINRTIDRPRYRRIPTHVRCLEHDTTDQGERVECPGSYTVTLDDEQTWTAVPDMVCDHDAEHRLTPAEWQQAQRRSSPTAAREFLANLRRVG